MAKYMIQDIIPPERKKTQKTGEKPAAVHSQQPVNPHVAERPRALNEQTVRPPLDATVSHAIHHVEEQPLEEEHAIHEEVAERPQ